MASHKISVTVDSARGLRAADVTGTSDPYAEVYIGDHRGKPRSHGQVQKTSTIKHTLNPCWNQTFTFDVNERELSSTSLVVKIMDWDRFTRNDKLGFFVTPMSKVMAARHQDTWFPLIKSLRSNIPAQGNVHLIISVDGQGPSKPQQAKPPTGAQAPVPAGAAAPYQPQYAAQPAYMGGGQQTPYMGGGQPQPAYMGGGQQQPMMMPPQQQSMQNKYQDLGTAGSSFMAPPPAQGYPAPSGMPGGYPPQQQQPMMQAPYMPPYGAPQQQQGFAQQSGAYPAAMPGGYPQQPAAPFGVQPQGPPQQQQQTGLAVPAAYIPSFHPQ